MSTHNLSTLLQPRGVVVVGASSNPDKLGFAMASSLESFPGEVRLVNSRPTAGMYESIGAAADGGSADLAIMCVPAHHTASALRESAEAGIGAALVCAGGFAEAGGPGTEYAQAVDDVVASTGIRLLGPNTSGFFVPESSLFASFVPGVRGLGAGSVAVVAASGGINHVLSFRLEDEGAGVSVGIGIGAGQDVAAPEILQYLITHDATRAVILHVETVADGRALVEAVEALAAVKPVIALVVGRNDVSDFAKSHTGALATSWRTTRAVLRQAGAILVEDEGHAVAAATALAARRARPAIAPGIGLITAQAGPGLVVADALGDVGALPRLMDSTREALSHLLPPLTFQANPVDTGRPGETFADVVRTVASDAAIDLLGVYAITEPVVDIVADVVRSGVAEMPVLVGVDGPAADVARVRRSGRVNNVPVLTGPSRLAQGLAAIVAHAQSRNIAREAVHTPALLPALVAEADRGVWDEDLGKQLLEQIGISCPPRRRCVNRAEALAAFDALRSPLAVKILDATVLHKTDVGGVVLGVDSRAALERALDALETAGAREFLVESMAPPGVDLVVGARRDPVFGPVVALGVGGTATELIADIAIRSAPLSPSAARSMIDDLVTRDLLTGFRGAPPVDLEELGRIVSALGDIVASGAFDEIEVNPLRSTPQGILALDAVVIPAHRLSAHKEVRTSL
jgi:acetyltransferase